MRRFSIATGGLAALAAAIAVQPATASAAPRCPRALIRGVARDRDAQVYVGTILQGEASGLSAVFGCTYATGRSYSLGVPAAFSAAGGGGIEDVRLNGTMAAFQYVKTREGFGNGDTGGGIWFVVVRDLRTGRTIRRVATGVPLFVRPEYTGVGPIAALVVADDGAVAWIAEDELRSRPNREFFDLEVADRSGTRLLAAGTSLKPSSLTLRRGTLRWAEAGGHRAARVR